MEEVEVCVSSLSFYHIITFNKWDNQTKLYDWGYSCLETRNGYNKKSYKFRCRISMCFPKLFSHWELFVAKWFRQKEYQNA
jgi:hypothetical protein